MDTKQVSTIGIVASLVALGVGLFMIFADPQGGLAFFVAPEFLVLGAMGLIGFGIWRWVQSQPSDPVKDEGPVG